VDEIVIGMAHRGRLNVMVNILEKNVRDIFAGFEDKSPRSNLGRGDVKYHHGLLHRPHDRERARAAHHADVQTRAISSG
jgi:2-oxoglutarate dehydrogenase complex dehydrogenase (E1) component-like enzyme